MTSTRLWRSEMRWDGPAQTGKQEETEEFLFPCVFEGACICPCVYGDQSSALNVINSSGAPSTSFSSLVWNSPVQGADWAGHEHQVSPCLCLPELEERTPPDKACLLLSFGCLFSFVFKWIGVELRSSWFQSNYFSNQTVPRPLTGSFAFFIRPADVHHKGRPCTLPRPSVYMPVSSRNIVSSTPRKSLTWVDRATYNQHKSYLPT